jgi:hypothetical protein
MGLRCVEAIDWQSLSLRSRSVQTVRANRSLQGTSRRPVVAMHGAHHDTRRERPCRRGARVDGARDDPRIVAAGYAAAHGRSGGRSGRSGPPLLQSQPTLPEIGRTSGRHRVSSDAEDSTHVSALRLPCGSAARSHDGPRALLTHDGIALCRSYRLAVAVTAITIGANRASQ